MSFPIRESKITKVGTGQHVKTDVTISSNGRVDGVTNSINAVTLRGFTGGSVVLAGDADGNILWGSDTHSAGVNATGPFDNETTGTTTWSETIPTDIIGNIETVEIVNKLTPRGDLWKTRIDEAIAVAEKISDVAAVLAAM